MEKIVVLNSGGFDSVVLMHYMHRILGFHDLHSLHFKYGARNEIQQEKCVDKVCEVLNVENKKITLPTFSWTKSEFYKDGYDNPKQYLEYRNLIFMSYAISFAQSIGGDTVALALLNQHDYLDTTPNFIEGLNFAVADSNITFYAPFLFDNKIRVAHIAKYLGVKYGDFFSCDNPDSEGNPCGICDDCTALKKCEEEVTNIQKLLKF